MNHLRPEAVVHFLRFTHGQPAWRLLRASMLKWKSNDTVVLDGYEQLSSFQKHIVGWKCRKNISILATMHAPERGFELVWRTEVDDRSAAWVIEQLLRPESSERLVALLQSTHWANSRCRHGQNLRESLFDMYDWWHEHSSSS
ncbi:MAG: hypothetical protein ABL921_17400 [Pirellula sp.]